MVPLPKPVRGSSILPNPIMEVQDGKKRVLSSSALEKGEVGRCHYLLPCFHNGSPGWFPVSSWPLHLRDIEPVDAVIADSLLSWLVVHGAIPVSRAGNTLPLDPRLGYLDKPAWPAFDSYPHLGARRGSWEIGGIVC